MTDGLKTVAITLAFATAMSAAFAAPPTGSRIGSTIPRTKPEVVVDAVARCYVAKHAGQARRLLVTVPGSAEESAQYADANGALEVCLNQPGLVFEGTELTFDPDRVRRVIATHLILRNAGALPATAPSAEPRYAWAPARIGSLAADKNAIAITHFAQCAVARDWANARTLVLAKTNSGEQKAAIKAIQPALSACLDNGFSVKIDKRLLPTVIGEGLYYETIAGGGQI